MTKFTEKEFDEEGAQFGKLEVDIFLDFSGGSDPVVLDKTKGNAVGFYYTPIGTPEADIECDVVAFDVDDVNNTARAKGTITYSTAKEIKWVQILLNYIPDSNPAVYDKNSVIAGVDESVGPGILMSIQKDIVGSDSLEDYDTPQMPKAFLGTYPTVAYEGKGIGEYYFGARYFDPELGVWGSRDPAQQFWSGYRYTNNPNRYIDPDGRFVLSLAFGIGYYRARKAGGDIGDAFKAGGFNTLAAFDPVTFLATTTTINSVTNVLSDFKGITGSGDFFSGLGKTIYSLGAGFTSGIVDAFNASTAGVFNEGSAMANSILIGSSHWMAYGYKDMGLAMNTSYEVLRKMYYYGASGSLIKIGGDLNWVGHANFEDFQVTSNDARYRFEMMDAKINKKPLVIDGKTVDFSTYEAGSGIRGHKLVGFLTPGKLFYYGFEAWGEPYERWVIDDYDADLNSGQPFNESGDPQGGDPVGGDPWKTAW